MTRIDDKMPNGITRIEPDAISLLLEKLIEVSDNSEYNKHLIRLNEELVKSQKKIEQVQIEIKNILSDSDSMGLSESMQNTLVSEQSTILESVYSNQEKTIEQAVEAIREASEKGMIQDESLQEEQKEVLEDIRDMTQEDLEFQKKERKEGRYKELLKKLGDSDFAKNMNSNLSKATSSASTHALETMMGPLQVITKPMEDFFNFNLVDTMKSGVSSAFSGVKGLFSRKDKLEDSSSLSSNVSESPLDIPSLDTPSFMDSSDTDETKDFLSERVRPTKRNLLQSGIIGASSVYLADVIEDALSGGEGGIAGGDDSFLDGIMEGGISGAVAALGPKLLKGAGIASLATAVIWGVVDGIMAAGKADEWGVSKVSATIAGFFAGSEGKGDIENAFKNAPKLALAGVGIGMAGGPLGMLAGGLIGAVVGGVLGYIGAENLAKFFDGVGEWFSEKISNVKDWLNEDETKAKYEDFKTHLADWFSLIVDPFIGGLTSFFGGWKDRFTNMSSIASDEDMIVADKITAIARELILGVVEGPVNIVKGWIEGLEDNALFADIKKEVNSWFKEIGQAIADWIWDFLPDMLKRALNAIGIGPTDWEEDTNPAAGTVEYALGDKDYSKAGQKEVIEAIETPMGTYYSPTASRYKSLMDVENSGLAYEDETVNTAPIEKSGGILKNIWRGIENFVNTEKEVNAQVSGYNTMASKYRVDDGIIYKDGLVVKTHPDDNIIATKDSPIVFDRAGSQGLDKEIEESYFKEKKGTESLERFDKMISLLQIISERVQGGGATIINNNSGSSSLDFNALRVGAK